MAGLWGLKIISMVLEQPARFTEFSCFVCLWDSRDCMKHYKQTQWLNRNALNRGSHNVIREPLIERSIFLLPSLHIKLGLIKKFTNALDKRGQCFMYLRKQFEKLSDAKIREGIFDGPQIRKMFKDQNFIHYMNEIEKSAWLSFKSTVENFLRDHKSHDYEELVNSLFDNSTNV